VSEKFETTEKNWLQQLCGMRATEEQKNKVDHRNEKILDVGTKNGETNFM
jgi:hypothetical protein